ncbi:transketolase family protein [Haloarcula litorea]|uniref:transketolase family protein n=1 Tax=Haloarcula litorea TaxID=3032579 RepID=UPI0023E77F70|nr:transketolase C-terminal domain-containing protein [Halomicroarcula sp. GDY20]
MPVGVTDGEEVPIRDGYGRGLLDIADSHPDVVVLDADLGASTRGAWFGAEYPDRWFNVGIAEQDMMVIGAGLASTGKTAFAGTFAVFSLRAIEQVRNSIARPAADVTVVGSHGGLATGPDGASAQAVEDVAAYRSLPNVRVVSPGDAVETAAFVEELAETPGPAYLRLVREPTPVVFDDDHDPSIGEGFVLREGADLTLVTHGAMLSRTLDAAALLADRDVDARVVHMPSIKPLDEALLQRCARETGRLVTVEDHSVVGGLGAAVAELVGESDPVTVERIGVDDTFGESGDPEDLYELHGLTADAVARDVVDSTQR